MAAALFALTAVVVVLGLATPAGAARGLQAKAPKELIKKYGFPQKLYLDQLPGAAILNPKGEVPAISITLVPARFTVRGEGRLHAVPWWAAQTMACWSREQAAQLLLQLLCTRTVFCLQRL
jgi:hypothetical protein